LHFRVLASHSRAALVGELTSAGAEKTTAIAGAGLIAIAPAAALGVINDPRGDQDHQFALASAAASITEKLTNNWNIPENGPFAHDLIIKIGNNIGNVKVKFKELKKLQLI
jgi:hypothetical protein